MADFSTNADYLGNLTLMQPGAPGSEGSANTSAVYGSYGSEFSPLLESIVDLHSYNDGNDGDYVQADHAVPGAGGDATGGAGDGFHYDLDGDGIDEYNGQMDDMDMVQVNIVYDDGTSDTKYMWVVQMQNEDTFLLPNSDTDPDPIYKTAELGQVAAESVTISAAPTTASNRNGYAMAQDYHQMNNLVCFSAGMLIATEKGDRPVETLVAGDRVRTLGHGFQDIRWIGSRHFIADQLAARPNLRPVRILKGALGSGLPIADLLVWQQHRVLVRSGIAHELFGTPEVLVAAKMLVGLPGIEIASDVTNVTYCHFLCRRQEIVVSNGAMTETLLLGPQARKMLPPTAMVQILTLFPSITAPDGSDTRKSARRVLKGRDARNLARQIRRHQRPVCASVQSHSSVHCAAL